MRNPTAARLQVIAAALLFSTGGAAIKATTMTGWQVASFRSGIAAIAIVLMLPAARRRWTWRALTVGVAYAATLILFVLSTKLTTAANTIFLQSTAPIYILLLAPWLLREPIQRRDLPFMAVLALGLLFLVAGVDPPQATAPNPVLGNMLALGSGVAWALTVVGLRWLGRDSVGGRGEAMTSVVAGNVMACLFCLPMALPIESGAAADAGILLYLGVFQIGAAYVFLTKGIVHVRALEVSLIVLLEPVLNPTFTWLIHGERPGAWSLLGGAIIVVGTAAKTLYGTRK